MGEMRLKAGELSPHRANRKFSEKHAINATQKNGNTIGGQSGKQMT